MDEVFGDVPTSPRRPNLGRETPGEVVLRRLMGGKIDVENISVEV